MIQHDTRFGFEIRHGVKVHENNEVPGSLKCLPGSSLPATNNSEEGIAKYGASSPTGATGFSSSGLVCSTGGHRVLGEYIAAVAVATSGPTYHTSK
jgi:hypothetical protein